MRLAERRKSGSRADRAPKKESAPANKVLVKTLRRASQIASHKALQERKQLERKRKRYQRLSLIGYGMLLTGACTTATLILISSLSTEAILPITLIGILLVTLGAQTLCSRPPRPTDKELSYARQAEELALISATLKRTS